MFCIGLITQHGQIMIRKNPAEKSVTIRQNNPYQLGSRIRERHSLFTWNQVLREIQTILEYLYTPHQAFSMNKKVVLRLLIEIIGQLIDGFARTPLTGNNCACTLSNAIISQGSFPKSYLYLIGTNNSVRCSTIWHMGQTKGNTQYGD